MEVETRLGRLRLDFNEVETRLVEVETRLLEVETRLVEEN